MAFTTFRTWVAGEVLTASQGNEQWRDNGDYLLTGGMRIASQATGDVLYASSATQLARLAIGSAGEVLRVNSGATAPEWSSFVLDVDTSTVQVVNTTTETSIYSFTVAANQLGTDKLILVDIMADVKNDRGSNTQLTVRLKYGATTLASAVVDHTSQATVLEWSRRGMLAANGATGSQRGALFGLGKTTTAGAEDSTGALTLDVTVQWEFADANTEFNKYYAVAYLIG